MWPVRGAAVSGSGVGIPVLQELAQTRSMPIGPDGGGVRIAELVATLSYAADLGLGQPMEHCLRQTVIALRLADLVEADAEDREATYYLGLLSNAYCHADASEQARWFGDDISFKAAGYEVLSMNTPQMAAISVVRMVFIFNPVVSVALSSHCLLATGRGATR